MLPPTEVQEIRELIHRELAAIESQVARCAGSYTYLCSLGGSPVFTHRPVGQVLRHIVRVDA